MSATIIGQVAWNGGVVNQCRCQVCRTVFLAGGNHYWHNHFYCSSECGLKANLCGECGGNRNFCECRSTPYEGW